MQTLLSQLIQEFDNYSGDDFGSEDIKKLKILVSSATEDDEEIVEEKLSSFLKVLTEANDNRAWRIENNLLTEMEKGE